MLGNKALFTAAALFSLTAACSGEKKGGIDEKTDAAVAATPSGSGVETPEAGHTVIAVKATTEADGTNHFVPNDITAEEGDVLRFTLGTGVHNVHFLPDSNSVKTGLPAATPMLQLPGQTYDIKVSMKGGKYYFQCDPHAALGMTGHLTVKD